MTRISLIRGLLAGLAVLLAPAAAHAAPVVPDRQARGTVIITAPGLVRKLEDLNFATLAIWDAGTATVDPNTDTMTTTGGVVYSAGLAYSAMFEAVSPVKNVAIIRIPRNPITITRVGGTETMTVGNWTLAGSANRNVVAKEPFSFKIGGTLTVGANQAEGLYVGTFDVEVQFP
jgi:hypothetical protein